MATLVPYRGLQVLDAGVGTGGTAINDDLKHLADRIGPSNYAATTDPTSSDNQSAGYITGSRWFNTTTNAEWLCTASSTSAATWVQARTIHPFFNASSGTEVGFEITSSSTQSGSAGFTMLDLNIDRSSTGSGPRLFSNFRLFGSSILTIDEHGTLSSSDPYSHEFVIEQTADFYGTVRLHLQNRDTMNGALLENAGLDLADLGLEGNSGYRATVRFEHRTADLLNSGNATDGEIQFIMDASGSPDIALAVGANVATYLGMLSLTPTGDAANASVVYQHSTSQSANLSEWRTQSNAVLAAIGPWGSLYLNDVTGIGAGYNSYQQLIVSNNQSGIPSRMALVLQGGASQSGALLQCQDHSGTALPFSIGNNGAVTEAPFPLPFSSTVGTDASTGNLFTFTATSNFTLANPTNLSNGQKLIWKITQDTVGTRTITFGTNFKFSTTLPSSAIVLSTAPNYWDYLVGISNGTQVDIIAFNAGFH